MTAKEFREMYRAALNDCIFYENVYNEHNTYFEKHYKKMTPSSKISTEVADKHNRKLHDEINKTFKLKAFLKYPGKFLHSQENFYTYEIFNSFFKKKTVFKIDVMSHYFYSDFFSDNSHIKKFPKTNILTSSWETEVKLVSKILGIPYDKNV